MAAVERSLDELWEMYGNGERDDPPPSTKSFREWTKSIEKGSYDVLRQVN